MTWQLFQTKIESWNLKPKLATVLAGISAWAISDWAWEMMDHHHFLAAYTLFSIAALCAALIVALVVFDWTHWVKWPVLSLWFVAFIWGHNFSMTLVREAEVEYWNGVVSTSKEIPNTSQKSKTVTPDKEKPQKQVTAAPQRAVSQPSETQSDRRTTRSVAPNTASKDKPCATAFSITGGTDIKLNRLSALNLPDCAKGFDLKKITGLKGQNLVTTYQNQPFPMPPAQECGENGICNNAPNYGNQTVSNAALPQRILTDSQRAIFIASLRRSCPFEVAVRHIPGNAESQEYADQIENAIREAGCTVRRPRFLIDTHNGYGLFVALHDTKEIPRSADALIAAMNDAAIPAKSTVLESIESGVPYIFVELNDSKQPR